jgi:hypothetical protein
MSAVEELLVGSLAGQEKMKRNTLVLQVGCCDAPTRHGNSMAEIKMTRRTTKRLKKME